MDYPSKRIGTVVEELTRLPGIGQKTALRLALHLLRAPERDAYALGQAVIDLRAHTRLCSRCFNLSDEELCRLCANPSRQETTVCLVADLRDVLALERAGMFRGLYHVLGGLISPLDGVGPDRLQIDSLMERLGREPVEELILALGSSPEADTTAFYVARRVEQERTGVRITHLARGLPAGAELEYADEMTLAQSFQLRTEYHTTPNPSRQS